MTLHWQHSGCVPRRARCVACDDDTGLGPEPVDNAFDLYHERIIAAIRTGDVVCVFFPRLSRTLIVDFRHAIEIPPAVFVEHMVSNARERLDSIKRLRPQLPLPDEVKLAPWMGFVRSLEDTGVLNALETRLRETNDARVVAALHRALADLRRVERDALRALVRGETTRTLWQRPRT